jgi:hypothetical protein
MKLSIIFSSFLIIDIQSTEAFTLASKKLHSPSRLFQSIEIVEESAAATTTAVDEKRKLAKAALFGLIGSDSESSSPSSISGPGSNVDPILADPITKDDLKVTLTGPLLGGQKGNTKGMRVLLSSKENVYSGRTNTYYNLLRPQEETENNEETTTASNDKEKSNGNNSKLVSTALNSLQVFIPPPLRPVLSQTGLLPGYIPMRDLFTSPSVSFAYERGWRQGFAAAGFPGADKEYELVKEFFLPIEPKVVVDMSCATGK